jgi:hypothetical protein
MAKDSWQSHFPRLDDRELRSRVYYHDNGGVRRITIEESEDGVGDWKEILEFKSGRELFLFKQFIEWTHQSAVHLPREEKLQGGDDDGDDR